MLVPVPEYVMRLDGQFRRRHKLNLRDWHRIRELTNPIRQSRRNFVPNGACQRTDRYRKRLQILALQTQRAKKYRRYSGIFLARSEPLPMHGGGLFFGCARHMVKMLMFWSLILVRIGVLSQQLSTLSTLLNKRVPAKHDF